MEDLTERGVPSATKFSEECMLNRKALGSAVAVPLSIGLIGLANVMHHPRFESIRSVDVLQLLASGMCFGVALAFLFELLRGSRNT
jgi:hypothetical protein